EFGNYFTLLFNGGTARLELTQPDDIMQTGVEIIAKPPGKRAAHLAMLSGGERALTAAALLFSILKVSPTPFCVMDEVDAMLDESNVGRFNDALKSLGAATQFIIITHNRRTIENSDTVYGITMGEDGVSQAISLRLNGAERAKATEEAMTIVARKTKEKRKI
ncbi:MAG: chromosome segregation protein SMC, partial [Chloroflexi bacterium]|nr:chromosome segregation protein SMC [Chloroflexota bacterium]